MSQVVRQLTGNANQGVVDVLVSSGKNGLAVYLLNGGGGGTSTTDETPFSAGVTAGVPLMAYDTTSGELLVVETVPGTRILQVGGTLSLTITPVSSNTASAPSQVTIGTTAALLLAANGSRKGFSIQNQGTTNIKLLLGAATPTQANYTIALPACGTANDGSSKPWYGPEGLLWTGAIQVISSAAGGLVEVVEFT